MLAGFKINNQKTKKMLIKKITIHHQEILTKKKNFKIEKKVNIWGYELNVVSEYLCQVMD